MSVNALQTAISYVRDGGTNGLGSSDAMVLYLLAYHLNDTTGECYPSEVTLAREGRLHVSTVKRSIARMEAFGLVSRSVRKTHDGDGRSYALRIPPKVINSRDSVGSVVLPSDGSVGSVVRRSWSHGARQLVAPCASVGSVVLPDKEKKENDSVCDRSAHTQGGVDNFKGGGACPSPFGIYDVEGAVRVLCVGDNPVPRSFIEDRARTLTADGGSLANGGRVSADSFVAHCRSWWGYERDKGKYLAPASTAKSKSGLPLAKKGEERDAELCAEVGCAFAKKENGVFVCAKGLIPPHRRSSEDMTCCRPDEKLPDGRYRSGCFFPKGGAS